MSIFRFPQVAYEQKDGYYNEAGKYVKAGLSKKDFLGTVQPMTSKDLKNLPEGQQDAGWVKVYSTTRLSVAKQGETPIKGDLILFRDRLYEARRESGGSYLLPHFKYEAVLTATKVPNE